LSGSTLFGRFTVQPPEIVAAIIKVMNTPRLMFRNSGALVSPLFVTGYFVEDCPRTISLIQIGANGEVHPLETG